MKLVKVLVSESYALGDKEKDKYLMRKLHAIFEAKNITFTKNYMSNTK